MILGSTRQVRVFAFGAPVDMRKGFEGLSQLVRDLLKRDVLSGELFLFVSRDRRRAKVLHFDGTGLCLYAKRLVKGQFASLWREPRGRKLELTATELTLFLEGSDLVGRMELSPTPIDEKDLAIRIRV
jgi:transposase